MAIRQLVKMHIPRLPAPLNQYLEEGGLWREGMRQECAFSMTSPGNFESVPLRACKNQDVFLKNSS